jgi:myo-inositol-1(or 4)-monophosphatase
MPSADALRKYMEFAAGTAYLAGQLTLGYFGTGVRPDFKADDSPVTVADRLAEQLIRSRIEQTFPDHAIVGEEFGVSEGGGVGRSHRWLIDPIDGTKSFMRGVPLYGVLLGLEVDGRVEAGAAYFPGTDEMLTAATGEGCWWNGRRTRVSQTVDLSRAYVSTTDLGGFTAHGRAAAWERIARRAYVRVGWSDAYGYLLVATGRIEIMLDPAMHPWDAGPFPAIFREAGGYYGDWQGNETIYGNEGLATTQTLLPEVLALIRGA